MKPALMFWTALLFLFAGLMTILFASGYFESRNERDGNDQLAHADLPAAAAPSEPLTDFSLQDQGGAEFNSRSLQGKIWVGSVFFSSCPSTCRVQNMRVAELQQLYGDRGVEFVSVTCDPERDTVAQLGEYAKMFGANSDRWHFLTGEFDLIRRIGNEKFGILVERETHSDRLVLFGPMGNVVGSFRSTVPEEFAKLKSAIDELLPTDPGPPVGGEPDAPAAESSAAA